MRLSGNTILITGGGTGIGLSLAGQLMKLNNSVIICGRRENKLAEAATQLPGVKYLTCDLTIAAERQRLAGWVLKEFPETNILINNAGIQNTLDLRSPVDAAALHEECNINLVAPVHLSSLFADHFMKKEFAAIINVSSGLAFTPITILPVYCATKSALHSYTLSLRHQLSNTSVKVFELIPPTVDTELDHGERERRHQAERGIKPDQFAEEAIKALRDDVYEAPVGMAVNLYRKREELFNMLNH
jgi:uncharacterized oxidoreductase